MADVLAVGEVRVEVVRKVIRNVHLTVHPPDGRVRLAAPSRMSLEVLRLFAIKKLAWIREQQRVIRAQERETTRECLNRESHYLWGRRYLLKVIEKGAAPVIALKPRTLVMQVRPGTASSRRDALLAAWHREQVRAAAGPVIAKWSRALGVRTDRVIVRRMKTKWGSCTPASQTIRLNTELAKKPHECLEYIIVHELVHLLEPSHGERFVALMDAQLPAWRERRAVLNRLPVRHEEWGY